MKYRPIFITATNTEIGKTYTTCKLINAFGELGLRVGVLKPIETGVEKEPLDGKVLLKAAQKTNPDLKGFTCKDIVPVQFALPAAPFVAKADEKIDFSLIQQAYERIASVSDIVLIEGAGGLMVPVEEAFYMYEFIEMFDALTLLVSHANLGCINDTLLNIEFLKNLQVPYAWCVNFRDNQKSFEKITQPYYEKRFGAVLSVQEHIRVLSESLLQKN